MGLFANIKQAQDVKQTEDRVGGSFKPLPSGVYKAVIKQMYAKPSQSGALGVTIEFEIHPQQGEPRKFTETYYVTNKNGENFYVNKNSGEKHYLAGFNHINDICLGLTQKTMFELEAEGKIELKNIKVYNYTTKKDEIEQLPTFVSLLDKEVALGLVHKRENKNTKVGNDYVPTAEAREYNAVDKIFLLKDGNPFTHNEVKAGLAEPQFVTQWLDKWKDQVDDQYKEVTGSTTSGTTQPASALNLG